MTTSTGSDQPTSPLWNYNFRILDSEFSDAKLKTVSLRLLERYAKHTKKWDADKNSEWICRLILVPN